MACNHVDYTSGRSRRAVYFKTILALALVLRLGVVCMVLFRHPQNWLFSNSPDLGFLAHSLSSGHGLCAPFGGSTGPTAFLAPGYPAILGLIFHLFGSYSFTAAAVMLALQTLFAVLTVAVILQSSRRMFGAPTANLAGTFWAVSPPLIWLPAVFWDTGLSALLLLGMVALALRCANQGASLGGHGSLLRPGDAGEPVAHAGLCLRELGRLANPIHMALWAVAVFAGMACRLRTWPIGTHGFSMHSSPCAVTLGMRYGRGITPGAAAFRQKH